MPLPSTVKRESPHFLKCLSGLVKFFSKDGRFFAENPRIEENALSGAFGGKSLDFRVGMDLDSAFFQGDFSDVKFFEELFDFAR